MPQRPFAPGITRHPVAEAPAGYRLVERSVPVPAEAQERVGRLVGTWGFKAHAGFEVPATPPRPGEDGVLALRLCGIRFVEPVRMLWAGEQGFGYETLPGHPLDGEESFVLDGGLFTVRSLSRPATRGWRMLTPALRIVQHRSVRRYLEAVRRVAHGSSLGR